MSRTYRKGRTWYYDVQGQRIPYAVWRDLPLDVTWGWETIGVWERQRDGNPNEMTSPPKWFKQIRRRRERAQVRQAIHHNREMPISKNTDRWDWW